MKFGEQLEQNLVPEWRAQYLNYRTGKRYVKAIARAVAKVDAGPVRRKTFPLSNPFTPDRQYMRMQDDDDESEHRSTSIGDIELAETRASSDANERHHVGFATEAQSSQSISPMSNRRPTISRLSIPTSSERLTSASKAIMSPDTPGALQRIATFVRMPTNGLELKMAPNDIVALREQEFFTFIDKELRKIQAFYEQKEVQASERLAVLRQQLHIMRTRGKKRSSGSSFISKRFSRQEQSSKASVAVPFTPLDRTTAHKSNRDYVRRRTTDEDVSYRNATQKLRLALQEFYRSLELLKSYSLLNLTAFRKLLKKCDKVNRPGGRSGAEYMSEFVLSAGFVKSNSIEEHVELVEDLYTRYFEDGNRKLARAKLRRLASAEGDRATPAFLNGVLIGVGLTFAVEGLVQGVKKLSDDDAEIREQTSFLLQIYAGYFLMLYLFSWFCFCCRIWKHFRVNYSFVFEFDPKHDLDWKQLSNYPSFLTLLMGVIMWLNFEDFGMERMVLWYPVLLIGTTLLLIFLPLPLLYWRSRRWFVIAHGRLLLSGIFAVEFRDFFMGDMYCSLSYAVANAELFFCLYIRSWQNPIRCSSSRSLVLGFLAALPAIWRALQCLRRFWDSKHIFPHLANFLKYLFAISTFVTLSLYRRHGGHLMLSLFVTFSSINAFYSLTWDVLMDFSLLQQGSKNTLLRDILAFQDHKWMYHAIIVLDPLLRFGWVPLVIFSRNIQHGSVVAFFVAFVEVTRRGLWTIFRVENEHCTNIASSKASRDIPLPYKSVDDEAIVSASLIESDQMATSPQHLRSDSETGIATSSSKQRPGIYRALSRRLARAHTEDFERRRKGRSMEQHRSVREEDQTLQGDGGSDTVDHGNDIAEEDDPPEQSEAARPIQGSVHMPPPPA